MCTPLRRKQSCCLPVNNANHFISACQYVQATQTHVRNTNRPYNLLIELGMFVRLATRSEPSMKIPDTFEGSKVDPSSWAGEPAIILATPITLGRVTRRVSAIMFFQIVQYIRSRLFCTLLVRIAHHFPAYPLHHDVCQLFRPECRTCSRNRDRCVL